MKYLLCSVSLLVIACSADYKALRTVTADPECIRKVKPPGIAYAWYDASIDVIGKHISGLLLIKEMPDGSTRIVFTNEAGVTFLDVEFNAAGGFEVKHVIKQLNKKAVLKTLQKDFELILGLPFKGDDFQAWRKDNEIFYGVAQKSETAYFITGEDCASLRRVELGSKRKRKVSVIRSGSNPLQPDTVLLQHHTFNMVINLKKLERP